MEVCVDTVQNFKKVNISTFFKSILPYQIFGFLKSGWWWCSINKKTTFHRRLEGAKLMHFPKLSSAICHVRSMFDLSWGHIEENLGYILLYYLSGFWKVCLVCSINKKTTFHRRLEGAKLMHFPKLSSAIGHVRSIFDLCMWPFLPGSSVRPKPGFGIGNRNQDQVSVSVS